MIFTFILLLSITTPNIVQAQNLDYNTLRMDYQHQADICDLINAREIVQIGATPLAEIKKTYPKLKKLIKETKKLREECYSIADKLLQEMLTEGLVAQNENDDISFSSQLELDRQLAELLTIRRSISQQLLDSMQKDIDNSLASFNKLKKNNKTKDIFITESANTRSLIQQDMGIVLDVEQRQLQLDERTIATNTENITAFARFKMRKSMHYLARTLMVYENIHTTPITLPLAKIRSEYLYANGQMTELLSLDPELTGLPTAMRNSLRQLINKMQLLELDIEGGLRDYRSGEMEENLNNWLSELYQDLSQLSLDIKDHIQMLPIGEIIMTEKNLPEIPKELADFIENPNSNTDNKSTNTDKKPSEEDKVSP